MLDNDVHKLNVELGVGARQSELQLGGDESETIFTAGGYYTWAFSETAEFRQGLRTEIGDKNVFRVSYGAIGEALRRPGVGGFLHDQEQLRCAAANRKDRYLHGFSTRIHFLGHLKRFRPA